MHRMFFRILGYFLILVGMALLFGCAFLSFCAGLYGDPAHGGPAPGGSGFLIPLLLAGTATLILTALSLYSYRRKIDITSLPLWWLWSGLIPALVHILRPLARLELRGKGECER